MKQALLFTCLFVQLFGLAQGPDQNWPVGIGEFPGTATDGNAMIRFLGGQPQVEKVNWHMNFESAVGAISDSSGVLLLLTNGCYLADGNGDTLLNGEGLNPGTVHDWVCAENGYPSPRGALILPQPGRPNRYFLFHNGTRYKAGDGLSLGPFYYTVIDKAANGGKGTVLEKNVVLEGGAVEPFSAVRHGNGRDWWLVVPEAGTNRYFRYLFSPTGITALPALVTGPLGDCGHTGSSVFSPDGSRFARQQRCRTIVFYFDRCTGALSAPLAFEQSRTEFGGGGVAFSPDGSQLFVSAHLAIFMANLTDAHPVLDTLVPIEKTVGAGLQFLQQAPDGSFYFSLTHRARFYPKFSYLGNGSYTFLQQGIPLPVYSVKSLPNFPNFNLLDLSGSACDTLGITPVRQIQPLALSIHAFPNPVSDWWQLDLSNLPETQQGALSIYDLLGHRVFQKQGVETVEKIDVSSWTDGVYFWKITSAEGNQAGGKFEKISK